MIPRQAGVLLPLFSLRSPADWGVGEIPDLVPFTRWCKGAGLALHLLLPVNEASRGQHSPYGALSAFALDPVYIALEALEDFRAAGGVDALTEEERGRLAGARAALRIHWDEVRALKRSALEVAFARFVRDEWDRGTARALALETFAKEEASWLEDYALFVALHDQEMGGLSWLDWPACQKGDPGSA